MISIKTPLYGGALLKQAEGLRVFFKSFRIN